MQRSGGRCLALAPLLPGGGLAKGSVVTVPVGASAGPVAVTGPGGTALSTKTFTVTPGIALSPVSGPPTTTVTVSGAGFETDEAVDIYVDTTDEALASASSTGNFAGIAVQVPASAVPGTHYLTAVGRHSGLSARAQFSVHTSWAQYRYSAKHEGSNPYENVLSASNVSHSPCSRGRTVACERYSLRLTEVPRSSHGETLLFRVRGRGRSGSLCGRPA